MALASMAAFASGGEAPEESVLSLGGAGGAWAGGGGRGAMSCWCEEEPELCGRMFGFGGCCDGGCCCDGGRRPGGRRPGLLGSPGCWAGRGVCEGPAPERGRPGGCGGCGCDCGRGGWGLFIGEWCGEWCWEDCCGGECCCCIIGCWLLEGGRCGGMPKLYPFSAAAPPCCCCIDSCWAGVGGNPPGRPCVPGGKESDILSGGVGEVPNVNGPLPMRGGYWFC